ncbi:MAG: phosphotransferase [Oscillospiraceae bacterium]|nr:phosphotransferase [Oscillospiraceae bacterium]
MEQLFHLLKAAGEAQTINQRGLAAACGISVGKVNALLRRAEGEGYLTITREGKRSRYALTRRGVDFLEHTLRRRQGQKLPLKAAPRPKTAVVLAAGRMFDQKRPAALQPLDDVTILDRTVEVLKASGIERVIITAGSCADEFKQKFAGRTDIRLVENSRYKWTGSMASLALAAGTLTPGEAGGGLLIVKGSTVFERRAVSALLESDAPFSVLLTPLSGTGVEILVELDELGEVFRFTQDLRQVNRVEGEFAGLARVSGEVLEMMQEYYQKNSNPMLNFEYVLENIGRLYPLMGIKVDDLIWGQVWDGQSYQRMLNTVYPRILRQERELRQKMAAEAAVRILELEEDELEEISFAGGITNTNFLVCARGKKYILRLPGLMTETLINRINEKFNAQVASDHGFNCRIIYCNAETGIKLSEYIEGAETMTPRTIRLDENMKKAADIFRRLHRSDFKMNNTFDIFEQGEEYERMMEDPAAQMYEGYMEMRPKVMGEVRGRLRELGYDLTRPCHCDGVAANWVKDKDGRLYLIDWEYSAQSEPLLDLAYFLMENEYTPEEEELFVQYYLDGEPEPPEFQEKLLLMKIATDFVWSMWALLRDLGGDRLGSYGPDRLARAARNYEVWSAGRKSGNFV